MATGSASGVELSAVGILKQVSLIVVFGVASLLTIIGVIVLTGATGQGRVRLRRVITKHDLSGSANAFGH